MEPLSTRITNALAKTREARASGDMERELLWSEAVDRLLEEKIVLLKAADKWTPLAVFDPGLYARLSVTPQGVKFVRRRKRETRS